MYVFYFKFKFCYFTTNVSLSSLLFSSFFFLLSSRSPPPPSSFLSPGIVGLKDPLRDGVVEAVHRIQDSGAKVSSIINPDLSCPILSRYQYCRLFHFSPFFSVSMYLLDVLHGILPSSPHISPSLYFSSNSFSSSPYLTFFLLFTFSLLYLSLFSPLISLVGDDDHRRL